MVEIGKTGTINNGEYKGWQISVKDDSENTGGFLVLIFNVKNNKTIEGYDDWVETREDLEAYFNEAQYLITWQ